MVRRLLIDFMVFLGALVLFGVGAVLWLARSQAQALVNPGLTLPQLTPRSLGVADYREVTLTTADGLALRAWYIPPPVENGGAIVYTHGLSSNQSHWLPELPALYEAGYGGIMFSFRNHGGSDGTLSTYGVTEVRDVRAALNYLLAQPEVDGERIMLVGDSFGASIGIMAAAEMLEIKGVVAVSPYASFVGVVGDRAQADLNLLRRPTADFVVWFANRLTGANLYYADAADAALAIPPRPMWLVHGTEDLTTPPINTYRVAEMVGGPAAEHVTVWMVEGVGHSEMRSVYAEEFQRRLLAFVGDVIGK